jgi:glycosyltransferase involved in cell wall biosynthesis
VPVPSCYCLHDDHWYLNLSLQSLNNSGPILAFISKTAWDGSSGEWERCAEKAAAAGAEVILGDWPNEELHRQTALQVMRERGYSFVLTPDGDEVIEPFLLDALLRIAKEDLADRVLCSFDTYWKSAEYVIRPREGIRPLMLVNLDRAHHVHCRDYAGGRALVLGPEYGVVHHLSYAGPDERIRRKLSTWGHKNEVLDGWYSRVWKGWNEDKLMRDLHPTHPPAYGWIERIPVPEILGGPHAASPTKSLVRPNPWPAVSVVIPLYGGPHDIRLCLESLSRCSDLMHEVIVVDDLSPDDAASVAAEFTDDPASKIRLLRNEHNEGFGATCNTGYLASTGEVVVFLNSDTVVPRSGLIRLIESLMISGSVGATGPYTNNAGYHQPIPVTYTGLDTMDLFAEDFAQRNAEDVEVPILVGFCLAVRRSVIEEVGEDLVTSGVPSITNGHRSKQKNTKSNEKPVKVPFDVRFGRGLFEDNDLVYRIQKAGYKIRIAARSFVHHAGSQSLGRMDVHPHALLEENKAIYHAKWREDINSGFASHLPGQIAEPIVFRPERHPEAMRKKLRELARRADISLCMIVRDEERVLGDCLKSAKDVFSQMIVVDTGSKDRTKEIAMAHGAQVYEIKWPDSFAAARNESMKYAKGNWIFWLDADDTLPFDSALALLDSAINAPKDVFGYVMPVQFVETELAGATRVDHLKLFRNLPGLAFEGRIHEQILPSLRAKGGRIARINGVVLHSGYDTSKEGQAKKRIRDEKLLKLDLDERPEHPFVLFNLGMTAHYCDDHVAALEWLCRSLAVSQPEESHVRKIYALTGVSQRKLGRNSLAVDTFTKGLEVVGEDPELRFQLALTLTELGQFEEAKAQYLSIQPEYEDHFSSFDISILGFKRFFNLGSVCLQLDQYREAKDWFRQAIATSQGFASAEAAENLFRAAMGRQDFPVAREALDSMRAGGGLSEQWVHYHLDLAALRGQNPEQALLALVQDDPMAIAPRLMLARSMLERGNLQAAQPHLQLLDDLGCAEAAFFRGVTATRTGDLTTALHHMKRARDLNPSHEPTLEQIVALEREMGLAS